MGTLVPEDIRWIPAQTDSRVDRIVIHPGAIVQPNSVILELSNPELQRDVLDIFGFAGGLAGGGHACFRIHLLGHDTHRNRVSVWLVAVSVASD